MELPRVLCQSNITSEIKPSGLHKISSKTKIIHVVNGASVNILFTIPIVITIQDHMFEMYPMVYYIPASVDLVLRFKQLCWIRSTIEHERSRNPCFSSRSVPVFPVNEEIVKPK